MGVSGGAGRAAQTVQDLLANPYVRRAVEDDAIRDNARVAYQSAREALGRAKGADNIIDALFDDEKLQRDLAATGRSIAGVREHLLVQPKRKAHWGRRILVVVAGAALALALSEGLRNKVLDVLFGAEEEFDYVSTTAPPEPAATPVAEAPAAAAVPEPQAKAEVKEPTAKTGESKTKAKAKAEKTAEPVEADAGNAS